MQENLFLWQLDFRHAFTGSEAICKTKSPVGVLSLIWLVWHIETLLHFLREKLRHFSCIPFVRPTHLAAKVLQSNYTHCVEESTYCLQGFWNSDWSVHYQPENASSLKIMSLKMALYPVPKLLKGKRCVGQEGPSWPLPEGLQSVTRSLHWHTMSQC